MERDQFFSSEGDHGQGFIISLQFSNSAKKSDHIARNFNRAGSVLICSFSLVL